MADFDARWGDESNNSGFPVTHSHKFDDWSAADESDPFTTGGGGSGSGGAGGDSASAGQSYGFGGGSAAASRDNVEDEFHDEEVGHPNQSKPPQPSRKTSGGASVASGRSRNSRSSRGQRPPGAGGGSGRGSSRNQRPPSGGRSGQGRGSGTAGSSGRGRGRSGRGTPSQQSSRRPPPQASGRGRGGGRGGGSSRRGPPPPGAKSRSAPSSRKLPPGTKRGPNGELIGPNGELLGSDGKALEKNQLFKDVEETGQWGVISRREKIGAIVLLSLITLGVILGVVFGVVLKPAPVELVPATDAPTAAPTLASDYAYERIKEASPGVTFPDDASELIGSSTNPTAPSQHKAAEYVLFTLPYDKPDLTFMQHYALYVFYLETNGGGWTNSDNWPTGTDVCTFYGIQCDYTREQVIKIVLSENGVSGMIPYEIVALEKLIEIDVFDNQLQGQLPYQAVLDHGQLSTLDVQSNLLTGTIPSELAEAKLVNFFIAESGLSGDVPVALCESMDLIFTDCAQNRCATSTSCFQTCQGPNCGG
mmetsp:Transcript_21855/g.47720  ORF Transcript_21855/g.47720 Transcript_21855/m.47720 type:complete len:533 (-) Transcript_21855:1009-2607(-)